MIACCGLNCDCCPIYLVTLEEDILKQLNKRVEIARKCNEIYKMNLQPEDITDCDGCRSGSGRLFSGCKDCRIRKCVMKNGLENCAFCNEFACESLDEHFIHEPGAKKQLEEIKKSIGL